jgi:hypothetical protein
MDSCTIYGFNHIEYELGNAWQQRDSSQKHQRRPDFYLQSSSIFLIDFTVLNHGLVVWRIEWVTKASLIVWILASDLARMHLRHISQSITAVLLIFLHKYGYQIPDSYLVRTWSGSTTDLRIECKPRDFLVISYKFLYFLGRSRVKWLH